MTDQDRVLAPSIVITTPVGFKAPDGVLNQSAQRNKLKDVAQTAPTPDQQHTRLR
jgi:hypothetical protein